MIASQRYLIMAGGTGGHIFPAMAVAKALRNKAQSVDWLGACNGMEKHIVPNEGFTLHNIVIEGFRGKGLIQKIKAPILLISAVWQAIKIIRSNKIDVVLGFGGYVSAPGGIAARLLGKTLVIHEQNSVAGSTNKLLVKLTVNRFEAFPNSLPGATFVGNPIRDEIKQQLLLGGSRRFQRDKIRLLIMGGSLGAEAINRIVPDAVELIDHRLRPMIWHQTGHSKLEKVEKAYANKNIDVRLDEFIADVASAYQWADLVICRSGALTVSEIAIATLPAIFIPYPYAIDNHQLSNAQWLSKAKGAVIVEQSELGVDTLASLIKDLSSNKQKLVNMSEQLKKIAMPDATEAIVSFCENNIGEQSNAA